MMSFFTEKKRNLRQKNYETRVENNPVDDARYYCLLLKEITIFDKEKKIFSFERSKDFF